MNFLKNFNELTLSISPSRSREEFAWGRPYTLDEMKIEWYVPEKQHLEVVKMLFEKYFKSQLDLLDAWVKGEKDMEKEDLLR